jgi:hypothetical protein
MEKRKEIFGDNYGSGEPGWTILSIEKQAASNK